ncbi:MAG: hypothetical protein ACK5JT_01020 [Hyphomicrobiaceae bacterium]
MAVRTQKKAAKPRKRAAARKASGKSSAKVARKASATAETEVDRLKRELAHANERIAELEEQRRQLADRIDWVIDSLHSLMDE